jgi:hypothetical protein
MKEDAEEIRKRLVSLLQERFEGSNSEEKKAIRDRLWNMIQYAIGRHDYLENYRTRYLTIATALLTVAAAGVAILVNAKIAGLPAIFLYIAFVSLGITGLLLIHRFQSETSPDYPYRSKARVKSWYYYYTLLGDEKLLRDLRKKTSRERAAQAYLEALESYTKMWSELKEWELLQEDLEQLLILYTLQAYKRTFVKRMARILGLGTAIFVVLLGLAGLMYLVATYFN